MDMRIVLLLAMVLVSCSYAWETKDSCPPGYSYYNGHECGAMIVPAKSVVIIHPNMIPIHAPNPIYEYDHKWWKILNGPHRKVKL